MARQAFSTRPASTLGGKTMCSRSSELYSKRVRTWGKGRARRGAGGDVEGGQDSAAAGLLKDGLRLACLGA